MHVALKLHPDSHCRAVTRIGVDVERRADALGLKYRVEGDISALVLQPEAALERADALWRHTCFEAFMRMPGEAGYCEVNLAPSRQWAAYAFNSHRSGMRNTDVLGPPEISSRRDSGAFDLCATVPHRLPDVTWRVGISVIIEETDGTISFWALNHAPGKADFHHSDSFAADLPAPIKG